MYFSSSPKRHLIVSNASLHSCWIKLRGKIALQWKNKVDCYVVSCKEGFCEVEDFGC